MKKRNVNPKEAHSIIQALEAGVVPTRGIQHLLIGRNKEILEVINILENVENGGSDIRFWVGDFGSGKSFMLRSIESVAIQKNFVVSTVDLSPVRRFQASDGKAKALYNEIINNLKVQSAQDENAIFSIIEEWINSLIVDLAKRDNLEPKDLLDIDKKDVVIKEILNITSSFKSMGMSFELGQAISKYYEGIITDNMVLKLQATRWISGNISTVTEARKELGINKIITDDNWYEMIKNLSELFARVGYAGFVINFDEVVNLYKLPLSKTRERNYEHVLTMYNECKSNNIKNLFINFGVTRKTIFDENRGMSSYGALKGRLGSEKDLDNKLTNINKTVLPLKSLAPEEIFTLLNNVTDIYNIRYKSSVDISPDFIQMYMEEQLNRPGADEFLTPRAVIKDYLDILNLISQNPEAQIVDIIMSKFNKQNNQITKDESDTDDEIEEIEVL